MGQSTPLYKNMGVALTPEDIKITQEFSLAMYQVESAVTSITVLTGLSSHVAREWVLHLMQEYPNSNLAKAQKELNPGGGLT